LRGQWPRSGDFGGERGFVMNRDEKISGIGGISAAVPFMKRDIRGRAFAT